MAYILALAALSEPTRRVVFERVIKGPRSVGEIAKGLPVSRPAVSQHLKVLKEAGLVNEQRLGTRRVYSADPKALGELRQYIDGMWRASLDQFAEAVSAKFESKGRKR